MVEQPSGIPFLGQTADSAGMVEHHGTGTGRPLVKGKDKTHRS